MRILSGEFLEGDTVRIDVDAKGAFSFAKKK
jgi:hypothetical protein